MLTVGVLVIAGGILGPLFGGQASRRLGAFALACCIIAIGKAYPDRVPLYQDARQVTQRVIRMTPMRAAAQFGFEMGTGLRTFISSTSPYVFAAYAGLVAAPVLALVGAVGFALGRALPNAVYLITRQRELRQVVRAAHTADWLALGSLVVAAVLTA
jgi:hypothetical protein